MALTPSRALLLIAGVAIAGVAVYSTGILSPRTSQISTDAPAPQTQATVESAAEVTALAETGETGERQEQVVVPAFDLLRAEPDGSLVIAGRAEAGSEVEIVSGSSVLAKATAGPAGDFAAVLDNPLKPGEHNIVLRATSRDNVAATSPETAIVSIPTAESGQVVALVQQPGEPSRLITAPTVQAQDAPGQQVSEAGAASDEPSGDAAAAGSQGTPDNDEPATGDNGQPVTVAEAKPNETRAPGADASTDTDAGAAAELPASTESPAKEPKENAPFIEAVEIDGRKVFVAGRTAAGRLVRVYANDILLGQTTASPDGRFLIEADRDLPVGDYIIRADILAENGTGVIARAAVPFERHQGEKIAAVAPDTLAQSPAPQGGGKTEEGQDAGAEGSAGRVSAQAKASVTIPVNPPKPMAADQASARDDGAPQGGVTGGGASAGSVSPPLEPVDGSVIIRRGDTLWQISRRIYGRGVRYTTIYLANQQQISDPDRIWPGQVFTVPDETQHGEKADLNAVGEQAVTPETTARQAAD